MVVGEWVVVSEWVVMGLCCNDLIAPRSPGQDEQVCTMQLLSVTMRSLLFNN